MNQSSYLFYWIRYMILSGVMALYFSACAYAQAIPDADILKTRIQMSGLQSEQTELARIEDRCARSETRTRNIVNALCLAFLFGSFCAIWAQNTGRNPLLWFFSGAFFSIITVLVILRKNSRFRRKKRYRRASNSYQYLAHY